MRYLGASVAVGEGQRVVNGSSGRIADVSFQREGIRRLRFLLTPRKRSWLESIAQGPGVASAGQPERVKVHDFVDKTLGKAIPYGIYDVTGDSGWVSVGEDHDTAVFAVETLRRWWLKMGSVAYPHRGGC